MTFVVPIKNSSGKKVGDHTFSANVCDESFVNPFLMHEYVVMYLANQRVGLAHTKTRGEVQRSGRKLYRQKGTGRARVGDAGSPVRRKGGVVFGPRNTVNYAKSMPKKMRRKALCGALTSKVKSDSVVVLDSYGNDRIQTKYAHSVLSQLDLKDKKTLVVLAEKNDVLIKSFSNIPGVSTVHVDLMNAYDLLSHKNVVFMKDSLSQLESA